MKVEIQALYDAVDRGQHAEAERILRTLPLGQLENLSRTLRVLGPMVTAEERRAQNRD